VDWSEKEEPGARRGSLRSPRRQDPGISAPTQADGPSIGSIDGAGRADVATFVSEAGIRHTSGCQSNSRSVVCAGRSQHLLGMASGGQCRRSRRLAEAVLSLKDAGVPSFFDKRPGARWVDRVFLENLNTSEYSLIPIQPRGERISAEWRIFLLWR
jgi:hypothetical protein